VQQLETAMVLVVLEQVQQLETAMVLGQRVAEEVLEVAMVMVTVTEMSLVLLPFFLHVPSYQTYPQLRLDKVLCFRGLLQMQQQ
jgi:hypothetical protein